MAKITIDGKACECDEGEYILQVARRCGVFIPALCYLSGGTPTLACRLCMVEADGKRVYSCNAKAKDGMVVYSRSPEIDAEREAITQVYCVNHPMACGVCDQSGECELQNLVLLMRVQSQNYAIRDTVREVQNWGLISYDASLCIVCERCITACKDRVGENALKLAPRGGDAIDKAYRDKMPKDAYAVWSKLQKSLISRAQQSDCTSCGECAAVCPTGGLIESAFKYASNAWECERIPASNPHSSDCELLYYDVKRTAIGDPRGKIYRVSSDVDFGALNAAARFGYDFSKREAIKDEAVFARIAEGIRSGAIKTIKFNSFITNEEARILELLREKYRLSLLNDEALRYQKFLREFSKFSGTKFYNASSQTIKNSDFIVICGTFLRSDAPNLGYAVNSACKLNKASGIYFHPFCDEGVKNYSKNLLLCTHDAAASEEILLWILQKFGSQMPQWLQERLDRAFEISSALGDALPTDAPPSADTLLGAAVSPGEGGLNFKNLNANIATDARGSETDGAISSDSGEMACAMSADAGESVFCGGEVTARNEGGAEIMSSAQAGSNAAADTMSADKTEAGADASSALRNVRTPSDAGGSSSHFTPSGASENKANAANDADASVSEGANYGAQTVSAEGKISKFAAALGLDEQKADELLAKKRRFALIVGEDFIHAPNSAVLARLAGLVQRFTPFKLLIVPPRTNSLGVALICELSERSCGAVLGYNEAGNLSFGALEADLDAPSLVQQEGSFTNYDKRVVPTNAALDYGGYELNDLACALGICAEHAISYTSSLGADFKPVKFDDLENFYDNGGANHRGYELENKRLAASEEEFEIMSLGAAEPDGDKISRGMQSRRDEISASAQPSQPRENNKISPPPQAGRKESEISPLDGAGQEDKISSGVRSSGDKISISEPQPPRNSASTLSQQDKILSSARTGRDEISPTKQRGGDEILSSAQPREADEILIYQANPVHQFNKFSGASSGLGEAGALYLAPQIASRLGVSAGEAVKISNASGQIAAIVKLDPSFGGAYLPYFDDKLGGEIFFKTSRFASVKIDKISNAPGGSDER